MSWIDRSAVGIGRESRVVGGGRPCLLQRLLHLQPATKDGIQGWQTAPRFVSALCGSHLALLDGVESFPAVGLGCGACARRASLLSLAGAAAAGGDANDANPLGSTVALPGFSVPALVRPALGAMCCVGVTSL
jgi:hypothetical protein